MTSDHIDPDYTGADSASLLDKVRAVPGRYWIALVLAILSVAFIVQNREDAEVSLLFMSVTAALWLVLLISIAVGVIIGMLLRRRPGTRSGRSNRRAGAAGP